MDFHHQRKMSNQSHVNSSSPKDYSIEWSINDGSYNPCAIITYVHDNTGIKSESDLANIAAEQVIHSISEKKDYICFNGPFTYFAGAVKEKSCETVVIKNNDSITLSQFLRTTPPSRINVIENKVIIVSALDG